MSDQQTKAEQAENGARPAEGEVLEFDANIHSDLHQRIDALEAELTSAKDSWMRSVAEFQNYKRRVERDRQDLIKSANASLILKLLPVLDDFDRAVENIPAEIAATPWWGGTQLVQQKLRMLIESEGVTEIMALEQPFDPNMHEAVLYEEAGEGKGGLVVAVLQKGYKLGERVLRPAMVKVGKE
jgi:molecular chaperone GrpE